MYVQVHDLSPYAEHRSEQMDGTALVSLSELTAGAAPVNAGSITRELRFP
jgi:hypothetical protein